MGKKSYDVKYVVYEHECVDVGCFEHRQIQLFNPNEKKEAFELAEKLNEESRKEEFNLRWADCCGNCTHHGIDVKGSGGKQCLCPSTNREVSYKEVCDSFKRSE